MDSFEITHWSKPGPITRQGLKDLIPDKDALFCLLTDKIDQEILQCASQLKVIGKLYQTLFWNECPAHSKFSNKFSKSRDIFIT